MPMFDFPGLKEGAKGGYSVKPEAEVEKKEIVEESKTISELYGDMEGKSEESEEEDAATKYKPIEGVKFVQFDKFGIPMDEGTDYQ